MTVILRPYQEEARDAILREWAEGRKRTLLVLPTGCGKTVCFASVVKERVDRGGRALIMAHRGELLDQAADKVRQVTGLECAYEKAGYSSLGSWFPVTVGSVQSEALTRSASSTLRTAIPSFLPTTVTLSPATPARPSRGARPRPSSPCAARRRWPHPSI